MRTSLLPSLVGALLLMLAPPPRAAAQAARPRGLRMLAINDFHGNLLPPPGGIRIADPDDNTRTITVPAGGAEHMATLVNQLREGHTNTIFVAASDLIGASPFLSAMFHDEPTIESLSMMGLALASVGNHEFDEGKVELLRMQNGGCHPTDNCQGPHPFLGAKFRYLAASTIETASGKTIFPPYEVREFDGIRVAFIGLTLKGTPNLVSPVSVAGLDFRDEADTVNALVPELKALGIEAIVVLIHEGGFPAGDYNECPGISGPIVDIVRKFDRAVDVVVSGHTHQAYVCEIDGRLVTSGDKYGTLVTAIDVRLDPATRDIISARADNVIVRTNAYAGDPEQTGLISSYDKVAAPIANRPAGSITETLSRAPNYADVFSSQPFRNQLVTLTLTGAQIKNALEQQWLDPKRPRILQVSKGFSYAWDNARPYGERVLADRMSLNGEPIDPAKSYRVTVNNYLAVGGDGFTVLKEGSGQQFGIYDVDALYGYFQANSPISPVAADR